MKKKETSEKKDTSDLLHEFRIAFSYLPDQKKYIRLILVPMFLIGVILFIMPLINAQVRILPLDINPLIFQMGGGICIIIGILYPYISWKNNEADINGKIHFFITHLRVLVISDLSLKEIIHIIGGNKAYGSLGEEMRKISVLSDQWHVPLSKSFLFTSKRTPSKILKDFLDRFSQSMNSGVDPREFIETEQDAVLEEYKTMYETSNDNITILNEVYVSLLISIIFVMSLGIVLPIVIGSNDMNTFVYISSFLLIISEGLLLYLLYTMVPPDPIWHVTGEKSKNEKQMGYLFSLSIIMVVALGSFFCILNLLNITFIQMIPFEIICAITATPLALPGLKTYTLEKKISRKERNFLSFLPSLGSISTMRGGKINESVYYLSSKDYGVLTGHIKDLYKRLRTRINDNSSWDWFGVDTGSNYIQRSSEMFRQATAASANPRDAARMISENIRKIRDLRVKKLSVVNTSAALFIGITFGIAFSAYTSLVIAEHLNGILLEGIGGDPFSGTNIDIGSILTSMAPQVFTNMYIIIFFVLLIHSVMMALTIRTLRGSHIMISFLYVVPFIWVVAVTAVGITVFLGGYLGM